MGSRGVGIAAVAAFLSAFLSACSDSYASDVDQGRLFPGGENRSSVAFAMNERPVRLELLINVQGREAVVQIDHPDGRTTDSIEIRGPGIRELCKEFPKEPGSWGLRLSAKDGNVAYWVALHDRKKYIGPDESARRFVEKE